MKKATASEDATNAAEIAAEATAMEVVKEKKGKTVFEILYEKNINDKTEKKNGLTYLSWAAAWAEVKKIFADASYRIIRDEMTNLPYICDPRTGYMVFTEVTINGETLPMWLPVMDSSNTAMKNEPYEVTYMAYGKPKTKRVEAATMTDINKALMRCLAKNLSMFGLGLYVYIGDDLPDVVEEVENSSVRKPESKPVQNKAAAEPQQNRPAQTVQQTTQSAQPAPNTLMEALDPAYLAGLEKEMAEKNITKESVCARTSWKYCGGDFGKMRFEDFMKLHDLIGKSKPQPKLANDDTGNQ